MSNLTIELPEVIVQQVQARGLSRQQIETLIINFLQRYLRDQQSERNGEVAFAKSFTKPNVHSFTSARSAHSASGELLNEAEKLCQVEQAQDDLLFMADLKETMAAFSETDAMWWEPI
jgi:hypothetical protein